MCPPLPSPRSWEVGLGSQDWWSCCRRDAFSPWGPMGPRAPDLGPQHSVAWLLVWFEGKPPCPGGPPPGVLPAPFPASAPSVGVGYRFPGWSPYLGDSAPSHERVPSSLLGSVLHYTGDAAHPTGHGCARSMPVEAQSPHATCGDGRGWDPLAWQRTVSHGGAGRARGRGAPQWNVPGLCEHAMATWSPPERQRSPLSPAPAAHLLGRV